MRSTTAMISQEREGFSRLKLHVDLQNALSQPTDDISVPSRESFEEWATIAYAVVAPLVGLPSENEVTLRLVEELEITQLNGTFRAKDKPTNVLSFPAEVPEGVEIALLGDVIICHPVVVAEAQAQSKTVPQHYAHMLTHGILHLCGYDHQESAEAEVMEALEIKILTLSALPNPYLI